MTTIVYADGGADPNPGAGGWGVVIQTAERTIELCGGERATTNNRMELTAAIEALSALPEGASIEMRCDSQYVVKSVTEWMPGWKRRGWRTATGPVKNQDLMERLDALASRRKVRWTWLRGHSGEPGNERADQLATQGRRDLLRGAPSPRPPAIPASPPEQVTVLLAPDLVASAAAAARTLGLSVETFVERAVRAAIEEGASALARQVTTAARGRP